MYTSCRGCLARLSIPIFMFALLSTLFIFVILLLLLVNTVQLRQRGVPAQGTVVEVQSAGCGRYSGVQYTVQFADQAGQVHRTTFSCDVPQLSVGDPITVVYLPQDPTVTAYPPELNDYNFSLKVFGPIVSGIVFLGLLAFCISLLVERRKKSNTSLQVPVEMPLLRGASSRDIERLRQRGDVEALIAALTVPSDERRRSSARALGEIRDPRAVDPLIAALHDPVYGVREAATYALGNIGDARAVGPLLQVLGTDLDLMAIAALQSVLVRIGDAQAVEFLRAFQHKLAEGDPRRGTVAFLLVHIQSSR